MELVTRRGTCGYTTQQVNVSYDQRAGLSYDFQAVCNCGMSAVRKTERAAVSALRAKHDRI